MDNFKGVLAYKGTDFKGWQKTKMGPSIEEALEKALMRLLSHPVKLQAASRTDAGVHAEGQVFNFFTGSAPSPFKLQGGIRALLPKDVTLLSLEKTSLDFHPTLHCKGKEYHYHITCGPYQLPFDSPFSWHIKTPLDLQKMEAAIPLLVGTKDFSPFCNEKIPPEKAIRTVNRISLDFDGENKLRIVVEGSSFLYNMVRILVGTLIQIGQGKLSLSHFPKKRVEAGMTAPAHGLVLKRVIY